MHEIVQLFQDTNDTLLHKFEHTEAQLSSELRQTREALLVRTNELETLKNESSTQHNDLSNQHQRIINSEREKMLQV